MTDQQTGPDEAPTRSTTTRCPRRQRPQLPDARPRRADPAARRALPEPDGALQPRAHPGAQRARQGLAARSVSSRPPRTSRSTPRPRCSSRASKTEMLARFSTVAGEQGSPDTWRDPRGFALKFYTTEGNYDLVGNNTPVFFIRDTMKFPHFIRSQKRRGGSGLRDNNMQWDFWSLNPESAHQVTYLMGDRGIPKTFRHMNGYGSHTYLWINEAGEKHWVKYHFHSNQGVEGLTDADATRIAGEDADFHRRDLYEAIDRRRVPELDPVGAGHAVRGRQDLPVQPVRPDQDLAAQRLPADQGRHDDPQPQPGQLLRPDRAGRVRAVARWCRASGSPRTRCCSAGRSPTPTRTATGSARTTCSCRSTARGSRSTPTRRRPDGLRAPRRTTRSTRPTRSGAATPTRSARSRTAGRPTARWCAQAYTLRADDDDFGQAGTLVREVWDDAAAEPFVEHRRRPPARRRRAATCSSAPSSTGRASTPTPASGSRSRSAPASAATNPGGEPEMAKVDHADPVVETNTNAG